MKTMKKIVMIIAIALLGLEGYAQATDVADFRIADATTALGRNVPVGTKIYNIATGDYWVVTAGLASTATLTTGSASLTQLNGAAAAMDLSLGTVTGTTNDIDITGGGTSVTINSATGANAGLMSAAKFNEVVANNAKNTNVSTALSTGTVNATTYGITSDGGANDIILVEATTSTSGLLGADKWDEIVANTAKVSNVSTNLSLGTVTGTTMAVNSSDGTNATLVAATGSNAGLLTGADKTKLDAIDTGAEVNYTLLTEDFEEDDGTATAHALSQTALAAQSPRVSLNGATLKPGDYTITTTTLTIGVPVTQYDTVVVTYAY